MVSNTGDKNIAKQRALYQLMLKSINMDKIALLPEATAIWPPKCPHRNHSPFNRNSSVKQHDTKRFDWIANTEMQADIHKKYLRLHFKKKFMVLFPISNCRIICLFYRIRGVLVLTSRELGRLFQIALMEAVLENYAHKGLH